MTKTIPKRIFISFILSFAFVVVIGLLVFYNVRNFLNSSRWESHTYQVLTSLEYVFSDIKDIETGSRGFVITGDETFLEPYNEGLKYLESDFSNLKSLISADSSSQIKRTDDLQKLIRKKINFHNKQIETRRKSGFSTAAALTSEAAGERQMDVIRRKIAEIRNFESDLLAERIRKREVTTFDVFAVTGIMLLFLTIAVITTMVLLRKELENRKKIHQLLNENFEYSKVIIDTVPNPLIVLDQNLNIISENYSFLRLVNHPSEEIMGKSFFEVMHFRSDYRELRQMFNSIIPEHSSIENYQIELADNRIVEINARKLYKKSNNVHMILAGIEDITDRKKRDEERKDLLEREQTARIEAENAKIYWRSLFEYAPGLYLVVLPEDYRIVAVSDAYLKATMTKRENIMGKTLFEVFPDNPLLPESTGVKNLGASLERVKQNKVADVMAVQFYPIRKPDEEGGGFEERYWSPVNSPVFDQNGELAYIIHRVEDVTEYVRLKESEGEEAQPGFTLEARQEHMEADIILRAQELQRLNERLRETQQRLLDAQKLAHTGSFLYDFQTGKFEWSEGMFNILGINPGQNQTTFDEFIKLIHPDDLKEVHSMLNAAIHGGTYHSEYRISTGAVTKYVHTRSRPIFDNTGKVVKLFGTSMDVTEITESKKRLTNAFAELERSNKDLEQFAHIVSHDLQEPLRMISGYLGLLSRKYNHLLDEEAVNYVRYAVDGAKRMSALIKGLLSYSRVATAGNEFQEVHLNKVLEHVLNDLKFLIDQNNVQIIRNDLPVVKADDVQMYQLFQNLIMNAIKFKDDRTPEIKIKSQKKAEEWIFSIEDNGIGIEPKDLQRIFIIFQRAHDPEKYPGSGLGLAICKKIVERHGGRIWVESVPEEGTTIYFTMPEFFNYTGKLNAALK